MSNGIIGTNMLLANVPAMHLTSGNVTEAQWRYFDMDILPFKRCYKCGEWKLKSEFNKDKTRKDGLFPYCKPCYRLDHNNVAQSYVDRNREKVRMSKRLWNNKNLDYFHEWNKNNPGVHEAAVRKWQKNNPDKVNAIGENRRARKMGNGGKITAAEWISIKEKYGNMCLYPGCNRTDITMDHVIPLALGGTHTADNVQPLCSHHNKKKSAKIKDYR